jgi:phenylalanyl-tRNA synthetase beta chain
VIGEAARMIVEIGGGTAEAPIDVVASEVTPKAIRLRTAKLHEASAGAVGIGYALDLFRRLGFAAEQVHDGLLVTVPTYRGDIFEEMDLIEEVLRFFGLNNVPAMLPRVTTGDVRREAVDVAEDEIRNILVGCGLSEVINYSFVSRKSNSAFSDEEPILITNSLSESITSMRLSLLGGLLDTVDFNRSYGTRDGAFFEIGRTYHRDGNGVRERRRAGMVLFGTVGKFWGDTKRELDFFDIKGLVEQIAAKFHVPLTYAASSQRWLRPNKRAIGSWRDQIIATLGIVAREIWWLFDSDVAMKSASEVRRPAFKGDVFVAEIDIDALVASSQNDWTMAPVARFPGVPMILALTHARDLEYQRIVDTIRSFDVPYLHEVGLRDRFVPAESDDIIKTTLGMWYQAFDRSLTQDEIAAHHHQLATRLADLLPVKLL